MNEFNNGKQNTSKIVAYIDGANLYKGVQVSGWKLDYKKFRIWLRQKFGAIEIFIFLGRLLKNADLYTFLQETEYTIVFKEIVYDAEGKVKGNCDADLVLQAVRDYYERKVTHAVLVSSDGDYVPLVKFWIQKGVLCSIISPAPMDKCSILLKKLTVPIMYLKDVEHKLRYVQNEKAPDTDASV